MANPCVHLQVCEDGVWAHFHVPGGVYWSVNVSTQGTIASRFGAQYREWVATNESATRTALRLLLDDVEGSVDMGMPFTDPENGFHESVMAARKALGR